MPWLLKPRCLFLPKSSLTIKLPIRSTVPSLVMPDLKHKGHLMMGITIYLQTPYCGGGTVERIATERGDDSVEYKSTQSAKGGPMGEK